jgi:soluble lytic murein transglycosylase-like protein
LLLFLLPWPALCEDKGKFNQYKLQLKNKSEYRLSNAAKAALIPETPATLATKPYAREIELAARASGLDPALVHALIHVESRYQQGAVSERGAIGLMQVLPETALRFGVAQPTRVRDNLRAGTQYLRVLLDRFDQRLDLALAAYNAGEGSVDRYQGIPPFAETQAYVPAVLAIYSSWRENAPPQYLNAAGVTSGTSTASYRMR